MGSLEIPASIALIPAEKMVVKNYDLYNLEQKRLPPIFTEKGEIIWIHTDLLKDEKWTTYTSSKKAKGKIQTSNIISMFGDKDQSGTTSLTDSEVVTLEMATHPNEAGQLGTRSGKNYLKDDSKVGPTKSVDALEAPPAKQKELHFQKDSKMDIEAIGVPFRFDVLV